MRTPRRFLNRDLSCDVLACCMDDLQKDREDWCKMEGVDRNCEAFDVN